jgi:CheY-like chemotaxis protein
MTHIVQAAQDATHVVSRLREFYRPAEKNEVREPVCLSSLCVQVVSFTAPKWKASGTVEVTTETAEVPKVLGNGAELREVLTNLIFNAVDAMPKGGTIRVRTRQLPDTVRVDIIDTGKGMTPEEKSRCLEPFFTTKGDKGTGLGLAVAYGIIQRHGGSIEIESEEGRGTTFSLVLPATSVEAGASSPVADTSVARALNVMVVDDQEIICELISEHLRADGHQVTIASDGHEALERFDPSKTDLVITDQSMPGLSGKELALALNHRSPSTPVILLTGFGDDMRSNGVNPEGISCVLAKPVAASDLRRAIFEAVK